MRPIQNSFFILIVLVELCCAISAARAGEGASAVMKSMFFDLPSEPLAQALQAYGERTGVQVLYESHSAARRRSAALKGVFSPDVALARLLSGTDLQVRHTSANAITLALRQDQDELSLPSAPGKADLELGTLLVHGGSGNDDHQSRLRDYSEMVQLDVQNALLRDASTRSGSYRFVARLWISNNHQVTRAELSQSTGDHDRDGAVIDALENLTVSATAPENTPQPVHVAVSVRAMQ